MLEYRTKGNGKPFPVLVRCPACDEPLAGGGSKRRAHIAEHDPTDFGLTPLGTR